MPILRRLTAHSYYTGTIFPESLKNTVKKFSTRTIFVLWNGIFKFSKEK